VSGDIGKVRHVLQAVSHLGVTGDFSYMPWTGDHPDYPYMGWRIEFLNPKQPTAYFYMYPAAEEENPTIRVFFGEHGDHTKDHFIGDVTGEERDE